jgi:hypothetical protein
MEEAAMSDQVIGVSERDLSKGPDGRPALSDVELCRLLDRASRGDPSCLPAVRALFDAEAGPRLAEAIGSPPGWALASLLDLAAGKDLAVREAATRSLARVRADLEGPDPTPMERLLAERAAYCWMILYVHEDASARARDLTFRQAEHLQSKIDRAHRRFLSAVKALATVRKLGVPAIQVNIAGRQVNVAGG